MQATLQHAVLSAPRATPSARTIVYWISTGLIAFLLVSGGAAQLTMQPGVIDGFVKLGYPVHLRSCSAPGSFSEVLP